MLSIWRRFSLAISKLDRFVTTKTGLFVTPIILAVASILLSPVFLVPVIVLSFILIIYRTIRIKGNKIKILFVSFATIVVSALIIRTYIAEARYINGDSMAPLIPNHTRVIVDKTSYILTKPQTGDVVVFSTDVFGHNGSRYPSEAEPYRIHISRVMGTPGDRLEIKEDIAFLNGKPLPAVYNHNLAGFTSDEPLVLEDCQAIRNKGNVKLNLCFYLLSDDNYQDRKDDYQFRVIPVQNIIGKVRAKFWPLDRMGNI
jgi:signal peptidase I